MLFSDLLEVMGHRDDRFIAAREISFTITQKLLKLPENPLYSTRTISKIAAEVLKNFDKRSYLRYVADHPSLQG
jgi:hypothetical protein